MLVRGVERCEPALELGVDRGAAGELGQEVRRQLGEHVALCGRTLGPTLCSAHDEKRLERDARLDAASHVLTEAEVCAVFLGVGKRGIDGAGAGPRVEPLVLRGAREPVVLDERGVSVHCSATSLGVCSYTITRV